MKNRFLILIAICFITTIASAQKWPLEKANNWYKRQGWLVGANYTPAYAINQLEFWQAETFNIKEIDKELGWAQAIGMNCMRVYLHHVAWLQDKQGFKKRINEFLKVANTHGIKIMFVFFDDCWNDSYQPGKQPSPKPGIHNSGWLKDPGNRIQTTITLLDTLESYVKDILITFKNEKRILLWDLYNEPGQTGQHDKSMPLLQKVFEWARSVNPSQPLSAGVHDEREKALTHFQISNSDIITYHSYEHPELHQRRVDSLYSRSGGRPMICTEYMARKHGSTFAAILPLLKGQNIGAINWGLVDGKTQTKYAWDEKNWGANDPLIWFHDIFRNDGTPYDKRETELIKNLTHNITPGAEVQTQQTLYIIKNKANCRVVFTAEGARLISLQVPDKNGISTDVVIGFNDVKSYKSSTEPYFGATIGRYANRIANGKFKLDNRTYRLSVNNGPNTLHGGRNGFQNRTWNAIPSGDNAITFFYTAVDGEEGFPGTLHARVTYTLTDNNELTLMYEAATDKPTVVNLTNHAFFNLNGEGSGSIGKHILQINAENYTPVNETLIPTGEIATVKGTPFDFNIPTAIDSRIEAGDEQLKFGKGYDHNYVLNGTGSRVAATVTGDRSGIVMEITTDQPGLQFYSGNFMQSKNKLRKGYDDFRTAFCLETQHFPDSPNQPSFPSTFLRPGEIYKTSSTYKFYTTK